MFLKHPCELHCRDPKKLDRAAYVLCSAKRNDQDAEEVKLEFLRRKSDGAFSHRRSTGPNNLAVAPSLFLARLCQNRSWVMLF
jgi:hypothetical protein